MKKRGRPVGSKNKRRCKASRPYGPREETPILITGLWSELDDQHRAKLATLGFDEFSWNNNVRERVRTDEFEMHVGGENVPHRFAVMTGDRARSTAPTTVLYEIGANF